MRSSERISTFSLRTKMSPPAASSAVVSLASAGAAATSAAATSTTIDLSIDTPLLAVEVRHLLNLDRLRVRGLQHEAGGARRRGRTGVGHERVRGFLIELVDVVAELHGAVARHPAGEIDQIGRASCRERV